MPVLIDIPKPHRNGVIRRRQQRPGRRRRKDAARIEPECRARRAIGQQEIRIAVRIHIPKGRIETFIHSIGQCRRGDIAQDTESVVDVETVLPPIIGKKDVERPIVVHISHRDSLRRVAIGRQP